MRIPGTGIRIDVGPLSAAEASAPLFAGIREDDVEKAERFINVDAEQSQHEHQH